MNHPRMSLVSMALATLFCIVACDSRPYYGNDDLSKEKVERFMYSGCVQDEVRILLGEPQIAAPYEGAAGKTPEYEFWRYDVGEGYVRLTFKDGALRGLHFHKGPEDVRGSGHRLAYVWVPGRARLSSFGMLKRGMQWMLSQQKDLDTLSVESIAQVLFVYSECGFDRTHKRYGLLVTDLLQRMCESQKEDGSFGQSRDVSRDAVCMLSLISAYNGSGGDETLIPFIRRAVSGILKHQMANGAWAETADDGLRGVAHTETSFRCWRALRGFKGSFIGLHTHVNTATEGVEQWFKKLSRSHLTRRFPLKYNDRTGEESGDGDVEAAYVLTHTLRNEKIAGQYKARLHHILADETSYISPQQHLLIASIFFQTEGQDTSWRLWQATTRHRLCAYQVDNGSKNSGSFSTSGTGDLDQRMRSTALFLQTKLLWYHYRTGPELEVQPLYTCGICGKDSY